MKHISACVKKYKHQKYYNVLFPALYFSHLGLKRRCSHIPFSTFLLRISQHKQKRKSYFFRSNDLFVPLYLHWSSSMCVLLFDPLVFFGTTYKHSKQGGRLMETVSGLLACSARKKKKVNAIKKKK